MTTICIPGCESNNSPQQVMAAIATAVAGSVNSTKTFDRPDEVPSWLTTYLPERIAYLGSLQSDWDTYGAPEVSTASMLGTLNLLAKLDTAARPAINPQAHGYVTVEWESEDGFLDVTVTESSFEVEYELTDVEDNFTISSQIDLQRVRDLLIQLDETT